MASTTYYVALPFAPGPDGPVPGEPIECQSALSAKATARALSHTSKYVGAIAFQRTGDFNEGEYGGAEIIERYGNAPKDLSAL
ncbi:hypothetical protein [Tardiphaga sp. 839_C3_N1_4]|uniref:hypothetical protein n=1 Tax=Tardiphaga sp. 839_C3_N1_4 TaxID=3240761 RepID=UPI003F20CAFB